MTSAANLIDQLCLLSTPSCPVTSAARLISSLFNQPCQLSTPSRPETSAARLFSSVFDHLLSTPSCPVTSAARLISSLFNQPCQLSTPSCPVTSTARLVSRLFAPPSRLKSRGRPSRAAPHSAPARSRTSFEFYLAGRAFSLRLLEASTPQPTACTLPLDPPHQSTDPQRDLL